MAMYYQMGNVLFIAYGINDGFWDVRFLEEKINNVLGEEVNYRITSLEPDGPDANLEFFGTPYPYIPSLIICR